MEQSKSSINADSLIVFGAKKKNFLTKMVKINPRELIHPLNLKDLRAVLKYTKNLIPLLEMAVLQKSKKESEQTTHNLESVSIRTLIVPHFKLISSNSSNYNQGDLRLLLEGKYLVLSTHGVSCNLEILSMNCHLSIFLYYQEGESLFPLLKIISNEVNEGEVQFDQGSFINKANTHNFISMINGLKSYPFSNVLGIICEYLLEQLQDSEDIPIQFTNVNRIFLLFCDKIDSNLLNSQLDNTNMMSDIIYDEIDAIEDSDLPKKKLRYRESLNIDDHIDITFPSIKRDLEEFAIVP